MSLDISAVNAMLFSSTPSTSTVPSDPPRRGRPRKDPNAEVLEVTARVPRTYTRHDRDDDRPAFIKTGQISASLGGAMKAHLDTYCVQHDVSASAVIRDALLAYFETHS